MPYRHLPASAKPFEYQIRHSGHILPHVVDIYTGTGLRHGDCRKGIDSEHTVAERRAKIRAVPTSGYRSHHLLKWELHGIPPYPSGAFPLKVIAAGIEDLAMEETSRHEGAIHGIFPRVRTGDEPIGGAISVFHRDICPEGLAVAKEIPVLSYKCRRSAPPSLPHSGPDLIVGGLQEIGKVKGMVEMRLIVLCRSGQEIFIIYPLSIHIQVIYPHGSGIGGSFPHLLRGID